MPVVPIGTRIAEIAAAQPDAPALTCADRTVTWQDLDRRTNRLARAYAELGVEQGALVTIGLPNGIEFYEAAIATWKLGATPQPVSWRLPRLERAAIIELAEPALVVGVAGDETDRPTLAAGFTPSSDLADSALPEVVAPALKAMTSGGSTGRPKLIVVTDPGVVHTDRRPIDMQPDDTQLVAGPLYHNAPFASTLGLFLGQHLVVMERFDAVEALELVARHRVTFLQVVPTMMLRMWRAVTAEPDRFDLSSLRVVWHMAAPCPDWLKERWIELVGPDRLMELYGGTEGQGATHISGREWLEHRGSVGRPAGGEFRIVDDQGDELPPGEEGEIFMRRSPDLEANYRYVGATTRRLEGGWESLGDMGWVDEDGYLYLSDRRTDLILSGGANVYPAEVEAAILAHDAVLSCVVVGLPDEDLGQRVHAVVEAEGDLTETDLRSFLEERLVRYKVPRSFRFVDEPLRDDAGKARRSAIRDAEVRHLGDLATAETSA